MERNICYNCFREHAENSGPCPHCGYDPAADQGKYPFALPHGSILAGQFITGRILGQGGFGITYLAQDKKLDTKVAIKEFLPDSMAVRATGNHQVTVYTGQRQENFRYGMDRFLDEARTLAKFQGNPSIVGVRSYFEENGTAYFVMDYIEGESFKTYIQNKGGKVSWQEAVRILTPVMDALGAVHQEGIIHRDVTPDNIVLTSDGGVKLLDFGSARYSLGDKSKSLDVVLKAGYAPKEQYIRRGKQGPYTDVYSLAACFYAAITGYLPPEALERMDEDDLVPPSTRGVKLPSSFEDVILKGLEVQPSDRYQSMEEFHAAMDSSLREGGFEQFYPNSQLNTEKWEPVPVYAGPPPVHEESEKIKSEPAPDSIPGSIPDSAPDSTPDPVIDESGKLKTEENKVSFAARIKALPKAVKGGVAAAACLVIVLGALAGSGVFSGEKLSPIATGGGGTIQDGETIQDDEDVRRTTQDGGIGQLDAPSGNTPEEGTVPETGTEETEGKTTPEDGAEETEGKTPAADSTSETEAAEKAAAEKAAAEKAAAEKAAAEKAAAEKAAAEKAAAEKAAAAKKAESEKKAEEETYVSGRSFKNSNGFTFSYTGDVRNGKPDGTGAGVFRESGAAGTYKGTWKNGEMEGNGIYEWTNGDKYEGTWATSKMSGSGTYTWANGSKYVGEFKNNNQNGKGTLTDSDGTKLVGNFVDNEPEGKAQLYDANGEFLGSVNFKKGEVVSINVTDQPYTMVTSKFSVSGTYTGEWNDGKPSGEGTMTIGQSDDRWDKGDTLYSAKWVNGLIEGYGQWRSAVDGAYDGNFSKGLKSGKGKMWFSDGTVYDGQWSGGDFVG